MKLAATVLASYGPTLGFALVQLDWSFSTTPSGGLNDITFPINMANTSHQSGYYFAQQFNFDNVQDVGYTGLQPRPDSNGNSIVHAAFSSFQNGTTTSHPNCSNGADGGPGVSCAVDIQGDYSHTYNCVVQNTGGTTWRGTLVDTVTGQSNVIGEWTLPSGSGKLKGSQVGFVEYYPWNIPSPPPCSSLPKTEVTFYYPTTNTSGAVNGTIPRFYETGNCVGQVGYSASRGSSSWTIEVGF
ncbi:hypothetical protein F4779DRAFT_215375 [Xylariaceae sp. FL0662B]|nr:hypothetical protein F4779DRAFT_215375 [Xylariaceae sp. FL0662B]